MEIVLIRTLAVGVLLISLLSWSAPVIAAENPFIREIQDRGVSELGSTMEYASAYLFVDESSGELQGYDIEIARGLARELDVDVYFDRSFRESQPARRTGWSG